MNRREGDPRTAVRATGKVSLSSATVLEVPPPRAVPGAVSSAAGEERRGRSAVSIRRLVEHQMFSHGQPAPAMSTSKADSLLD